MRTIKVPEWLDIEDEQAGKFRVMFDYDEGEPERWNGLTGVGNPETPPSLEITAVDFGGGLQSPDAFPQLNIEAIEAECWEHIGRLQEAYWADYAEHCERERA